ncbi:MAG: sugar nucleotide-binding protein [Thermosynechococcaceae cyanobacterium]
MAQIVTQGLGNWPEFVEKKSGLYHLTSTGETTWYGFTKRIFELTEGGEKRALKSVLPISSAFYPSPVQRPDYSLLGVDALERSFGLRLPGWDAALGMALEAM